MAFAHDRLHRDEARAVNDIEDLEVGLASDGKARLNHFPI
jgi:hypothetical protein